MAAERSDGRLCIGAFAGARGVGGELRIKSFTDNPADIGAYGAVETEDGSRQFVLKSVSVRGDDVTARVDGVNSRDAAMALKGTRFYVSREALPVTEDEDEFYVADLIGLTVERAGQGVIGKVLRVQDFGAGDLVEIRLRGKRQTVLVPFTKEAVPVIDIKGARIVIEPPPGLLDEPSGKDVTGDQKGES